MANKEVEWTASQQVASQESSESGTAPNSTSGGLINASGHVQELNRNFSLWSLAGVGLSVGNVWPAIGGSILVAIFNGGPPGLFRRSSVFASKLIRCRCALRVHRCLDILLVRGSIYRRACFCYPIISGCLSMGICDARKAMGTHCRLLCRLLELACVDIRSSFDDLHFVQHPHSDVCCQPP